MVKQAIFNNKKGISLGHWVSLALIITFFVMIVGVEVSVKIEQPLGENQYQILEANENSEIAKIYLEQSFKYALDKTMYTFLENKQELQLDSFCGEHVHPIYFSKKYNCIPDFNSMFKVNLDNNFQKYFKNSNLFSFYDWNYYVLASQSEILNEPILSVDIVSEPNSKLKVPIGLTQDVSEISKYPIGPLGTCGSEVIRNCSEEGNECIAEVAESFYKLYALSGLNFPYVWGGESPYQFKDTLPPDGRCSKFFQEVSVSRYEPDHPGVLTEPGFDCSGWVWWVGKHAGIEVFNNRLTANDYYLKAKEDNKGEIIWEKESEDFTPENASDILIPGDVLFSKGISDRKITHIMIYVGDLEIIHSRSSKGLIKEKIPAEGNYNLYGEIQAVVRYLDPKSEETSEEETSEDQDNDKNCVLYFNPSIWKEDRIREKQKGIDFLEMNSQLMNYPDGLFVDAFEKAAEANPNVPTQLVKAIIYAETGGVYFDEYISGKTKCSALGYCGLMQMGSPACSDVNEICHWDTLKTGSPETQGKYTYPSGRVIDFRQLGVESGAAYLSVCMKKLETNGFATPEKPNYYFTALLYNAGLGNGIDILNHAMERKEISKEFLKWSDVTKEDIEKEFPNDSSKVLEVYGYPNMVGKALSLQCSGDPLATYTTGGVYSRSYIEVQPSFNRKVEFDLNKYKQVGDFITHVVDNCKNKNLKDCISESIDAKSSRELSLFYLSDYSKFHFESTFENILEKMSDLFSEVFSYGGYYSTSLGVANYNDVFRDTIVDQILNCYYVNQSGCVCPIYVDYSLLPDSGEIFTFLENSNNEFVVQSKIIDSGHYSLKPNSKTAKLPFNPLVQIKGDDLEEFADDLTFKFEKTLDTSTNKHTYSTSMSFTNKTRTDLWDIKENNTFFTLYKISPDELGWYYYEDKPEDPPVCMNGAYYHRFAANFQEPDDLRFSLYLEDKTNPTYDKDTSFIQADDYFQCLNKDPILISWKLEDLDESIYAYKISVLDGSEEEFNVVLTSEYEVLTQESLKTTNPTFMNKLYYDEETKKFFYLTDKIGDVQLNVSETYTLTISPIDQYNNSKSIHSPDLKTISKKVNPNTGRNQTLETLKKTSQIPPEMVIGALCFDLNIDIPLIEDIGFDGIGLNEYKCCKNAPAREISLSRPKLK